VVSGHVSLTSLHSPRPLSSFPHPMTLQICFLVQGRAADLPLSSALFRPFLTSFTLRPPEIPNPEPSNAGFFLVAPFN
jgi:hypothetical protein